MIFTALADTVEVYAKELKTLADDARQRIVERNRQLEEGVFRARHDPRRPTSAPGREEVPPDLNFAPFDNYAGAQRGAVSGRRRKSLGEPDVSRLKVGWD